MIRSGARIALMKRERERERERERDLLSKIKKKVEEARARVQKRHSMNENLSRTLNFIVRRQML